MNKMPETLNIQGKRFEVQVVPNLRMEDGYNACGMVSYCDQIRGSM